MTISDAVVGNLTTLYLAAIAVIKAYGLVTGRSFGGAFVLIISTAAVVSIVIATLTWDVSRKATFALASTRDRDHLAGGSDEDDHVHHETCRGGICWHGVAVKSPASQIRFRLPQHPFPPPHNNL